MRLSVTVSVSAASATPPPLPRWSSVAMRLLAAGLVLSARIIGLRRRRAGQPVTTAAARATATSSAETPVIARAAPSAREVAVADHPERHRARSPRRRARRRRRRRASWSSPRRLFGGETMEGVQLTGGNLPAVAALRRRRLALVVRAELRGAVGALRGRVERHERQLRDRQPGVELDRDAREVVELEREGALPARVDEAGGGVDDQAEAPDRALALDRARRGRREARPTPACARGRTRRGGSRTARRARSSTSSVRFVGGSRRSIAVDAVVVEDAEGVAEPQVDERRLDHRLVPGIDDEAALLDQPADRAVGERRRSHGRDPVRRAAIGRRGRVARAGDGAHARRRGERRRVAVGAARRGRRGRARARVRAGRRTPLSPARWSAGSCSCLTAHQTIPNSIRIGIFRMNMSQMRAPGHCG